MDCRNVLKAVLWTGLLLTSSPSLCAPYTQVHRLKSAAVTVLLKETYTEKDKKGRKTHTASDDEEDIDVIGLAEEDWLVLKVPALDIEESLSIQKALLWQHRRLLITTGLQDTGVCILSKSVMDILEEERDIAAVESELIPLLVRRQFLPKRRGGDNPNSHTQRSTAAHDNRLSDKDCKALISNLNPISAYNELNGLSSRSHNVRHHAYLNARSKQASFVAPHHCSTLIIISLTLLLVLPCCSTTP